MDSLPNIVSENERYIEIYKICNKINGKVYIGQCVSHILNHKKFRKYGFQGRFKSHISESNSKKKNQCNYLNNALRKYSKDNFIVELIDKCDMNNGDTLETKYILEYNSIYPNGYNLKLGGKTFKHTDESKKRLSNGVKKYFEDKKISRFIGIVVNDTDNIEKYIRPLRRDNQQYGWYVYISGKKADFGGTQISLETSKEMAIEFIKKIIDIHKKESLAKHLAAGSS